MKLFIRRIMCWIVGHRYGDPITILSAVGTGAVTIALETNDNCRMGQDHPLFTKQCVIRVCSWCHDVIELF